MAVAGETHQVLRIRNPLARDSRDAQRGGGTAAEIEIRLLANLCGVAPAVIEVLDMSDYLELQKQVEVFMAG